MTEHFTIHDDKYDVQLSIRNAKDYLDFLFYKHLISEHDKNTLYLMLDGEIEDVNMALVIVYTYENEYTLRSTLNTHYKIEQENESIEL
jgi:hypothetical protein